MKIAVFHELPIGGGRRAVNEIAIRLKKNNIVDLHTVDEKENVAEREYFSKVFFYKFPSKQLIKGPLKRLYKDTIELLKLYFLHKKIAAEIRGRGYDFLLVHASKFIEAPFILRFPNKGKIFYCHDPYYRLVYEPQFTFPKNIGVIKKWYERINRFVRKILDKQNFYGADLIIANSSYTQEKIKKIYNKESFLVYLGVDENFFTPKPIKEEYDVLFIGYRDQMDGYNLLEGALRYLPKNIRIKTVFTDQEWLDDKHLRDAYRKSKLIVCLGRNEPFGLIPLEAMACGVPVVALNKGGYKESIENGKTGILVEEKPKKIAVAIAYLLRNTSLREKMGKNARQSIEKSWTWDINAKKFSEFFLGNIYEKSL